MNNGDSEHSKQDILKLIYTEIVRSNFLTKFQISAQLESLPVSGEEKKRRFEALLKAADDSTHEFVQQSLQGF